MDLKNTLLT